MNLREAIESTSRLILFCKERRWAATDKEGVEYDSLDWHESIVLAVCSFVPVHLQRLEIMTTHRERRAIEKAATLSFKTGDVLVFEWNPALSSDGTGWHRPWFELTKDVVEP